MGSSACGFVTSAARHREAERVIAVARMRRLKGTALDTTGIERLHGFSSYVRGRPKAISAAGLSPLHVEPLCLQQFVPGLYPAPFSRAEARYPPSSRLGETPCGIRWVSGRHACGNNG